MEQTHIALPDCTDYRRGATDLGHFGRYYLPHYFTRPSPPSTASWTLSGSGGS